MPETLVGTVFAAQRRAALQSSWRHFAPRLSRDEFEKAAPQIVHALAGRELSAAELRRVVELDCDVPAVIKLLCDEGVLVHAHPARGWRDAHHTYALMADWLTDVDIEDQNEADATRQLVRDYLTAYGPVSEADIAWWTGLAKTRVRAALSELADELAEVEFTDTEGPFIMLRSDLEQIDARPATKPSGITLLPMLDPYVQGYKERRRYLAGRSWRRPPRIHRTVRRIP